MRSYQWVGLVAVAAGVTLAVGLRIGQSRAAAPGLTTAVGCETCCGPGAPSALPGTKPPAIPTGSGLPCLVEFGADECGPCLSMAGVLGEVEPKLKGKVDLVRVDTDVYLGEVQRWRLRMVPTQILVDAQGKELWRHEGYIAADDLMAKIRAAIPSAQ
jgi:thioredoxin 1